ncbi:MAG: DUF167 domain-containing protein [Leptolyngbyaceae cyanobacterium CSU_1_4]|nr:DUF167 domain-containing protein [Leptolyngbyaceae cyanobacterium CSU_1_4]
MIKILHIKVKPNAKQPFIQRAEDGSLIVSLKSSPVEGKANAELIKILAAEFKVAKSDVQIKSGLSSKYKRVEIEFP